MLSQQYLRVATYISKSNSEVEELISKSNSGVEELDTFQAASSI